MPSVYRRPDRIVNPSHVPIFLPPRQPSYNLRMSDPISATLVASVAALAIWLTVLIVNRRRFRAICAAAALAVLLPLLAVNLLIIPQRWNRLDAAKLAMLRKGMTQADVERLLGGPPGCYGNPKNNEALMTLEGFFAPSGCVEKLWFDDFNQFELYFDASGQLAAWHKRASFSRGYRPPSWLQKVREFTGL